MTSSKFRGNIPFRPTPQTCYPPPPPPLNPDWVPCIDSPFGPYASLSLDARLEIHGGIQPGIDVPRATNIALVTLAPGMRQWTARITDAGILDIQIGIRCWGELYGNFGWQTMLTGRVTTPDHHTLQIVTPWAAAGTVTQTNDGHRITIEWDQPLNGTSIGKVWNLHTASGTLRNQSDTQRSRPPNPPNPDFGLT